MKPALSKLPRAFTQPDPRTPAVLVDELDAALVESSAD